MRLGLELALLRWAAVSRAWQDVTPGSQPELSGFLAGWMMCAIGARRPEDGDVGDLPGSFWVGWREAASMERCGLTRQAEPFAD